MLFAHVTPSLHLAMSSLPSPHAHPDLTHNGLVAATFSLCSGERVGTYYNANQSNQGYYNQGMATSSVGAPWFLADEPPMGGGGGGIVGVS